MVKRWLRRGTALVLAAVTLVTVAAADDSTPDGGSAAKWLLRWTLGSWLPSDGLSPATALVLGQSPLLLSARSDVADFTAGQQDTLEEPETEQEQEPDTPAVNPQTPLPASPRTALAFQDNGVPSQTVKITNTAGYTVVRGVCIKNGSNKTLDADTLAAEGFAAQLTGDAPQVLILHTHGSEAYTMPAGEEYTPSGSYRTADTEKNMIRVGDEMAAVLSQYGISVLHDRQIHDTDYNSAYDESYSSAAAYLEQYPSISFILDVHRDAISDADGQQYKVVSQEDPRAAQVSIVMGSSYDTWMDNLRLAAAVQEHLLEQHPTLMRPIILRYYGYNQSLSTGSMLVEIGAAGNSLDEAIYAARLFAAGFAETVGGVKS